MDIELETRQLSVIVSSHGVFQRPLNQTTCRVACGRKERAKTIVGSSSRSTQTSFTLVLNVILKLQNTNPNLLKMHSQEVGISITEY